DNSKAVHASEAIMRGMVPEGGLYLPDQFPKLDLEAFRVHVEDSYQDLAKWILGMLLDDFTEEEVASCVTAAYNEENFEQPSITPLVKLTEDRYILELWHGPTAAFKDLALQIMPHLLVTSLRKNHCQKKVVILVATSGDTGKAALEGFKNVPGTEVVVFYPHEGVSPMQELQMVTTDGNNTHVVAVKGNFDDCQTAVKELFADQDMIGQLDQIGYQFSSANSINWGRLSPQVVYYVAAYLNLVRRGQIKLGDYVDFSVPTGNFGNILAAYIAKEMGLPIGRLICASNENNVLTDFFRTGCYDANRPFYRTISPSMDILISSNLERYLYLKSGRKGAQIAKWMDELK
ncbi:MAG: threonine synthase, partial [Peptococcus niger]